MTNGTNMAPVTGDAGRIIIFGNAASGAGKTLTLAQAAVAFLRLGRRVGILDLAEDDYALGAFLDRRRAHDAKLPQPDYRRLPAQGRDEKTLATALTLTLAEMAADCDIILIDTPRAITPLVRLAHGYADIIVTPLRDIDLPSLATLKGNTARIETPAPYAEMLEDQQTRRQARFMHPALWLALRARMPIKHLQNKKQSIDTLDKISGALGFTPLAGLHERPLYNELFAKGITPLDLEGAFDMAHIATRQEIRSLVHALTPAVTTPVKNAG